MLVGEEVTCRWADGHAVRVEGRCFVKGEGYYAWVRSLGGYDMLRVTRELN